jgi:hypothetical protein
VTLAVAYRLGGRTISESTVFTMALVAALGGVMVTRIWRVGRLAVTAVHEGGHALVALLAGHTVTAVHLRSDSSGTTFHQGRPRWSSLVVTATAGYVAPGLVAVAGAALTVHHDTRVWLALVAGLGALMVVGWVRNLFGIVVIGGLVLAVGLLLARGTSGETVLVGSFATWYLTIGGLRAAVEQLRAGGRGDAHDLGLLLRLPPILCRVGFVAFAAGCVLACVALLFRL